MIRADSLYLDACPLPRQLLGAFSRRERVYVGGMPHRVEIVSVTDHGQIIGKLEPVEPAKSSG